jgi:hypothetical protein
MAKTKPNGKEADVNVVFKLEFKKDSLKLSRRELKNP